MAKLAGDIDPVEPYTFDKVTTEDSGMREQLLDELKELSFPSHMYLAHQVLTLSQELIGKPLIGDTTSVLGCYKLLATLRSLCG